MMNRIFLFAFLAMVGCQFSLVMGVTFKDCGSVMGKVRNVTVSSCGSDPVCTLPSGQNVSLSLSFLSYEVAKQVTGVVHGIVGVVPISFPLPQPNACKGSGLKCPLQKGADYVYTKELEVKSSYPKISLEVKWELVDESKKDIVCILIPAKITSV